MRIVFIGCVESSARLLRRLIKMKADVVGVLTQKESAYNTDFADIEKICNENKLDCMCVKNINTIVVEEYIRERRPDIIFCFGWSQLIRKEILDIPKYGCVGFHPADLPNNKGRHPIIWALVLGLEETASTFFMMNEKADDGEILSQKKVEIKYTDNARILYDKIMDIAEEQVEEIVKQLNEGKLVKDKKTGDEGNSWRKRGIEDGRIDWRMSSRSIYNLVRGLSKPYVGAHFVYKDCSCKVWRVEEVRTENYLNIEPGKVIKVFPDGTFWVKAGENVVHIIEFDEIEIKEGIYL